ncbi:putative repressor protein cI [Cylindrospermopsis phage Cr-LKS3]|nr:putative repressor protein cI [Cylindrospermopsis phage Cr-LKS3]
MSQPERQPHEILTARLSERGLTRRAIWQALVRRGLKVSESAVGHYFSGERKRPRDMKVLMAICKELDLRVDEVLTGEPSKAHTGMEEVALQQFRALEPAQQEAVLLMMKTMAPRHGND